MFLFQTKIAQSPQDKDAAFRVRVEQIVKTAVAEVSLERKAGFSAAGKLGWDSKWTLDSTDQNIVTVHLKDFSGSETDLFLVAQEVREKVLKKLTAGYNDPSMKARCTVAVMGWGIDNSDIHLELNIGSPASEEKPQKETVPKRKGSVPEKSYPHDPDTRYTEGFFNKPGGGGAA